MMRNLDEAVRELTVAVNGIDWDARAVQNAVDATRRYGKTATREQLDAALAILVERLEQFQVEAADGIAHVALTGGTLTELGAAPEPLAKVLLDNLPHVLRAARRYGDRCLADPNTPSEDSDDEQVDTITELDQRPIPRMVFRSQLDVDRGGGAALAHLQHWTLPAVAAWTRAREWLTRAANDRELVELAEQLAHSEAHWLRTLLGVQLDATWLILCPLEARAFRVRMDGVVTNHDLHALLAAELVKRGISGIANPDDVIAFLKGRGQKPSATFVMGTWNLYDYRAAKCDLTDGDAVPHPYWVWGEGIPNDVRRLDGERTLIVGPTSIVRTWNVYRMFSALPSNVIVIKELDEPAFQERIQRALEVSGV